MVIGLRNHFRHVSSRKADHIQSFGTTVFNIPLRDTTDGKTIERRHGWGQERGAEDLCSRGTMCYARWPTNKREKSKFLLFLFLFFHSKDIDVINHRVV
ncbi:Uncharacterized protein TCM_030427 [Theobroma cacao]|uniref:Uncharacterized protein n=1 Tax=Theobroma cacao TaxID=3641 RepID=A0A061GHC9_THECC|nr:Uncharacterized protein TCM_030427 [Theobroma cacao]